MFSDVYFLCEYFVRIWLSYLYQIQNRISISVKEFNHSMIVWMHKVKYGFFAI